MNARYNGAGDGDRLQWNVNEPFCHPDNQAVKTILINYCLSYLAKVPDHWKDPTWYNSKLENHYRHRRDQSRKSSSKRAEEAKRKRDHSRRTRVIENVIYVGIAIVLTLDDYYIW